MRLFSHSPADSSLPELAPPCSCSAVLHVTWVLSISRSTAITSLCKYSGWYPTFHALLSHYALIQASSLDASFGRTLLLYILQHPRDQSSPLWTVRSLSSVTCHWLHRPLSHTLLKRHLYFIYSQHNNILECLLYDSMSHRYRWQAWGTVSTCHQAAWIKWPVPAVLKSPKKSAPLKTHLGHGYKTSEHRII